MYNEAQLLDRKFDLVEKAIMAGLVNAGKEGFRGPFNLEIVEDHTGQILHRCKIEKNGTEWGWKRDYKDVLTGVENVRFVFRSEHTEASDETKTMLWGPYNIGEPAARHSGTAVAAHS